MQLLLLLSIAIRLAAMVWSVVLLYRLRDWRMACLTVTLALMASRQLLTLRFESDATHLMVSELPGLVVSVAALLAVVLLGRMLRERRAAETHLRERARQQAAVARLGETALREKALERLMDEAVEVLAANLEVELAKVLRREADGRLLLVAGVGWQPGRVGQARVESDLGSQAGYTLSSDQPVVLEDARSETRFSLPPLLREHDVVSGMSVALRGEGKPFGVLGVHSRRPRRFSENDIHFLESVANLLAAAVRRCETEQALRESEERLRQSQKMEAIGQLAGGVAHDFNNLLTAIFGYTDLLRERCGREPTTGRYVAEIGKAADRAAELTQQLLAFGRRQVLEPRVLQLNDVVTDIEQMLRRLIGEDIDLATVLDPALDPVIADRGQLQQALMNLAVNARDAMPDGGRVTIETRRLTLRERRRRDGAVVEPGSWAVVAVSDTGCGMDVETREHVFEPFFTTKNEGTGLGLSTVYGIAKQSGGYIWVASEPDRGTTFELWLPIVDVAAAVEERPAGRPTSRRGSETVLLVEDDDAVRRLTRQMLEANGYTVLEASRGEEALNLVERHGGPIHLLLTDVVMPQMGGRQVAEEIGLRHPETKVLFMSGYTADTLGRHGVLRSGITLLAKPFTSAALAAKVREVLDGE